MLLECVDNFVSNEIGQRAVPGNFAPGWTDQTISGNFGAPQEDVLIQPSLVYASGTVVRIGEENKAPRVVADEYSVLQSGVVQGRPLQTLLDIADDWQY